MTRAAATLAALLLAACAPALDGREEPAAGGVPLPPPGLGTLREDQLTVTLQSGSVQLRLTPLEEGVIRLAAPDTHRRLSALAELHRSRHGEAPGTLALVTFLASSSGESFDPGAMVIETRGGESRPRESVALTPEWGGQRLEARTPESAVVRFAPAVELALPFTLRYAGETSRGWGAVIERLERERARLREG